MERIPGIVLIVGLSVLSGYLVCVEGTCDIGAADSCISTGISQVNSLPWDNQEYCRRSGPILQETVACVVSKIDTCSSQVQNDFNIKITQDVGSPISNKCSGISGCENFLADLIGFHTCTNDAGTIASQAAVQWNDRLESKPACSSNNNDGSGPKTFQDVRTCFRTAIGTCSYLKDIFTDYLMATPNVKMTYVVCGSEYDIRDYTTEPVCTDAYQKEQNIRNVCGMASINWNTATESTICQSMQSQINCMVREAGQCHTVLDTFLKPRMDAYALMNRLYDRYCNLTLHAYEIYSVTDSGTHISCDFNDILSCLDDFGFSSSTSTNEVSVLRKLFSLTNLNVNDCVTMKFYDFNEMETCVQGKLGQCFYPWVTQREQRTLPDPLDYAPSLGPFLFNDVGLDIAGEYIHINCFQACQESGENSVQNKLTNDCNDRYNLLSLVQSIATRFNNGQNVDEDCLNLQDWSYCVSELVQQCPRIVDDLEQLLADNQNLRTAIDSTCNTRIVLYPTPPTQAPGTNPITPSPGPLVTKPRTAAPPETTVITTPSTARQSVIQSVITTTKGPSTPVPTTAKGFTHGSNPPTTPPPIDTPRPTAATVGGNVTVTTTTTVKPSRTTITTAGGVIPTISMVCLTIALVLQRVMS